MVLGAIHRAKGAKSYVGVPTILIAGPYLGAVLCEALAPLFHSEPLPQLEGPPIARLATAISLARPLSWNEVPWSDGPLFLVAGFLFIALLRELDRSERSSTLGGSVTATIAASAILVAAHVVHAVAGLSVRFEAAATDALFFSLGAGAAHVWLGALTRKFRGAARPRAFLFSYSVLLVLWAWRPLIPEFSAQKIASQVTLIAFVPLGSLATRVDVFSVLHVAQQFLLYVPVGALLAVWPLRAAGKSAGLWPVVWFVLALEVGHLFVAERLFDMTNAMIAVSGLGLAWLGVRRSGFRQYGTLLREKRPVL
ncbi:MAG: hypothetical protein ABI085_22310 [Gemmatimonadaceae bacterium]